MDALREDLRFAVRTLLKSPGFAAVAILTLALGIGANTAIFSVVDAILLRPLPYPRAERLVALRPNQSLANLADLRGMTRTLDAVGGYTLQAMDFTGDAEPIRLDAGLVDRELFDVLGTRPALGRLFSPDEDRFGGPRAVVLTHGLWQSLFGGDPGVVGRSIPLAGEAYSVVGVLEPGFTLPQNAAHLLAPLRVANPPAAAARGVHFLRAYARLREGGELGEARAEMTGIDRRLEDVDPVENKDLRTQLVPLHERLVGEFRPALLVVLGAVGLVLLMACANLANLLLARAGARQQEMAVRAALGASSTRLVRQVLTESVLLALVGGAAGVALAAWSVELLRMAPGLALPRLEAVAINGRVLLFALGAALGTGLLFGAVPALSLGRGAVLRMGGRGSAGPERARLRNTLLASEVALAVVLLMGAGLLIRTFRALSGVDPGFDASGVVTLNLELPAARYEGLPEQRRYRARLLEALDAVPAVEAALVSELPLGTNALGHNAVIEGQPEVAPGEEPTIWSRSVAGDYFRVMRIPIRRGRDFTPADDETAPLVGIANESLAREHFGGRDAIGGRVRWARLDGPPQWITIVGVAADIRQFGMGVPEEPALYTPFAQWSQPWKRWMNVVARTPLPPSTVVPALKTAVWRVDPQIPVARVQTLEDAVAASVARQRLNAVLLGSFAALALALAAVGIYGVAAHGVAQRTREIGIRMALGAQRRDVLRMVAAQGLRVTGLGIAIGVPASLLLARLLTSLLFGVQAHDPLTLAGGVLTLSAVAALALLKPARRATRVDPAITLRYE